MTAEQAVGLCYTRGVRLCISGDELKAQGRKGAISDALKLGLAEHKAAIIEVHGDGTFPDDILPDDTLPNVLVIPAPASLPNTVEAFTACIDAQRVRQAA